MYYLSVLYSDEISNNYVTRFVADLYPTLVVCMYLAFHPLSSAVGESDSNKYDSAHVSEKMSAAYLVCD